ncbi:MAG: DUF3421 domain-containing protein [Legionella sp.]|nr:DUF3421 domain-containing protein [Legionella sp.]
MRFLSLIVFTAGLPLSCVANTHAHMHGHSDNALGNALQIGNESNGKPLYLCIAKLFNSAQPGKTWEGYGQCNVPYGGKEYVLSDFRVPARQFFNKVSWQNNPGSPIVIGRDSNGSPLFLCQSFFQGSNQPGKTWPGYNHCNISFGGREIILNNYRILGTNEIVVRSHQNTPRAITQHW